jgi:hypothetical protein
VEDLEESVPMIGKTLGDLDMTTRLAAEAQAKIGDERPIAAFTAYAGEYPDVLSAKNVCIKPLISREDRPDRERVSNAEAYFPWRFLCGFPKRN